MSYFKNARSAVQDFFQGRRHAAPDNTAPADAAPRSPLAADIDAALAAPDKTRLLDLLRPQQGLASALRELQRAGSLPALFPGATLGHSILAI